MSTTTIKTTEVEQLEADRKATRDAIESVKNQMFDLSARLRELQLEEGDLTIRLINAHFAAPWK